MTGNKLNLNIFTYIIRARSVLPYLFRGGVYEKWIYNHQVHSEK